MASECTAEDAAKSRGSETSERAVAAWGDYPGAVVPLRTRTVDADGARIAVVEWGAEDDPILLLAHGGADFARTFDVFGPLLAAGGYRVVSWDHRSHGDSEHTALQSWDADRRDAWRVLESSISQPDEMVFVVGHSKGGGLMTDLAAAQPERFHCLVNIDGVPSSRARMRQSEATLDEKVERRRRAIDKFLDFRASLHEAERRPGTPEDLAERRAKHNPRLPIEWLRYLVTVGARADEDGWRWKLDPAIRWMGLGPWRPDWGMAALRSVTIPTLAILGRVQEPMGWGTQPEQAAECLPKQAELQVFDDSGHFVHIEHPERTARAVLEFLRRHDPRHGGPRRAPTETATGERPPGPAAAPTVPKTENQPRVANQLTRLRHGRLEIALHNLRPAKTPAAPTLLCLHELGGRAADFAPLADQLDDWPGAIYGLDFAGHGASDWAPGGGYHGETLLGDVDTALRHLAAADQATPVVLLGRGLGAYAALLGAGARPGQVAAVVMAAGAGLCGAGVHPADRIELAIPAPLGSTGVSTDPIALADLANDVRPVGYAAVYVRQLEHVAPTGVAERQRPIWVRADENDSATTTATCWTAALSDRCSFAESEPQALVAIGNALRPCD